MAQGLDQANGSLGVRCHLLLSTLTTRQRSGSSHLGLVYGTRACEGRRVAGTRASTVVIVEESAALQELVEQAVRADGDCVLVTGNLLEVLDVARRVRIDGLVGHPESVRGLL